MRYIWLDLLLLPIIISLSAPSGGQGVVVDVASSGFIVVCNYSHSNHDDPIVYPGQPGASHSHDFVGATTTSADSTAKSLAAGDTTCLIPGDKSAYWIPTGLLNGEALHPDGTNSNVLIYYRRKGAPDGVTVQPFPPGLKIIVGNAHAMNPSENDELTAHRIIFKCGPGSGIDLPLPPLECASGILVVSLKFPNCWNGTELDSADHKSHMAYPEGGRCPESHPVVLPRIESFFRYDVGTEPFRWAWDSGPYYTVHQDFMAAWNAGDLQSLVDNCLNEPNIQDCGVNPSAKAP